LFQKGPYFRYRRLFKPPSFTYDYYQIESGKIDVIADRDRGWVG